MSQACSDDLRDRVLDAVAAGSSARGAASRFGVGVATAVRRLAAVIDKTDTAGDVWADTAYRSKADEKHLEKNGLKSEIPLPPQARPEFDGAFEDGKPRRIAGPLSRRGRFRSREIDLWPVRLNHRSCRGKNRDRAGQPRLQRQTIPPDHHQGGPPPHEKRRRDNPAASARSK